MLLQPDEIELVLAALRAHRRRSVVRMRTVAQRIRDWTDADEAGRPGYREYLVQKERNHRSLRQRIDRLIDRAERSAA